MESLGALDMAKHFLPQNVDHTYSYDAVWGQNSLIQYWDSSYASAGNSGRLDYNFWIPSADGKVKIEPTNYQVIKPMSPSPITAPDYAINGGSYTHTDSNLSDHYLVLSDARLVRVAP